MATNLLDVQVFSAGCPLCDDAVETVHRVSAGVDSISVLDLNQPPVAEQARALAIARAPAVVIDGMVASCCGQESISEKALREAGVGERP